MYRLVDAQGACSGLTSPVILSVLGSLCTPCLMRHTLLDAPRNVLHAAAARVVVARRRSAGERGSSRGSRHDGMAAWRQGLGAGAQPCQHDSILCAAVISTTASPRRLLVVGTYSGHLLVYDVASKPDAPAAPLSQPQPQRQAPPRPSNASMQKAASDELQQGQGGQQASTNAEAGEGHDASGGASEAAAAASVPGRRGAGGSGDVSRHARTSMTRLSDARGAGILLLLLLRLGLPPCCAPCWQHLRRVGQRALPSTRCPVLSRFVTD